MANATKDLAITRSSSPDGRTILLPMGDTETVFGGTMVAQDTADGGVERINTGAPGLQCVGVATHGQVGGAATADEVVAVETGRVFVFNNSGTDAITYANTQIGEDIFAEDDNTLGATDQTASLAKAGTFDGLEDDGRVRVYIEPRT
jgi:hypothetical protein